MESTSMKQLTSRTAALALCAALWANTFAQSPPPPQQPQVVDEEDVVRITTNLVQFDAVVTDKAGRQVTDLRAEDFEVLEDGKPQQITNLAYVALDRRANQAGRPAVASVQEANVPSVASVASVS